MKPNDTVEVAPIANDNELPGMWERADFEGGPPPEVRGPDWKRPAGVTAPVKEADRG